MNLARRILRPFSLTVLVTTLVATCVPAFAQWVWKDEAGHTIASDQPPPASTPPSRIIKEPRKVARGVATTTASAPAPAPDPNVQKSLADRDLEAKQKAKSDAEAQKKADDDAKRAQAMKENCAQVKSNVAALQSGGRAARFNEKGEKVYIDDVQRQAEINRQQAQVSQYCNNS
jgi:hypothetical protein